MTFPDEKMIEAAFQTVPGMLVLCLADVEDIFATGLDDYRTRTGIDVADVVAKLSAKTHVVVPIDPTEGMIWACQAAMKNQVRSMSAAEKAAKWGRQDLKRKDGFRFSAVDKAKMRYRAMIRAAQEKVE